MAGGDEATFTKAEPVIRHYGRAVTLMGPAGSGQLTKMVNQICIAGIVQGLAEAIAFGEHAGLDVRKALSVIGKGAAQSWQMENRGETMIEGRFDFGFAVDWMRKDLSIVLDEARRNGGARPGRGPGRPVLRHAVQANGGKRWDTSSLITLLRDCAIDAYIRPQPHLSPMVWSARLVRMTLTRVRGSAGCSRAGWRG